MMKDFKMFTVDPNNGRVILRPPNPPELISGKDKLTQVVLLSMLNNPGRNAQYPTDGSGLPSLIGSNIDPNDPSEILADISERLEKIKEEVIQYQNGLKNETPSERLRDLVIVKLDTGTQIDEVMLKFKVISEAGEESSLIV